MIDQITRVLHRFANCFDLKAWDELSCLLSDTLECDYQDLRGTIEFIPKHEYIALRRQSLDHLKTQHLFSNLDINIDKDQASCCLNALICRHGENNKIFNTHAIYNFKLIYESGQWKIGKIKQTVLWNEGDPSIHSGVKQK